LTAQFFNPDGEINDGIPTNWVYQTGTLGLVTRAKDLANYADRCALSVLNAVAPTFTRG